MVAVRQLHIENFRGIAKLTWAPAEGINAVVGPGDSGKSTILEAIDLVLGGRGARFTDADFHGVETSAAILIEATVGGLPDKLLSLEGYGRAIRGWSDLVGHLQDEPGPGYEPVITLRLRVADDCEPVWSLYSDRLAQADLSRDMKPEHRALVSAQRLGTSVAQHLAWGPRSVLSRLTDSSGSGAILASANRAAREMFKVDELLGFQATVTIARAVAQEMAVSSALGAQAMLDARAVNVGAGAISLHDEHGIPLRGLGIGSSRLMAAGLQVKAAEKVPILLLDEAEHGLEPHRIARLLHKLGSKAKKPSQQVFLTTHSPVVLRELSSPQLWIARRSVEHTLNLSHAATFDQAQNLLRLHPDAFLSPSVLVCEGPTEQGLVRGLDLFETDHERPSLALMGVSLVNGGGIPKGAEAALQLSRLGFRVALLRDSDRIAPEHEEPLTQGGGTIFCWQTDFATENQIFESVPDDLLTHLIAIADHHHTSAKVNDHLSGHGLNRDAIAALRAYPAAHRKVLAKAARSGSWYKRIEYAEDVGRTIVGPHLDRCTGDLKLTVEDLKRWCRGLDVYA